jgi:hypothetical protein
MQFLEPGENPVGEIDIDAERIKNLALKLKRQSFAYQQMVVFGAPARSRQVGGKWEEIGDALRFPVAHGAGAFKTGERPLFFLFYRQHGFPKRNCDAKWLKYK